MKPDLRWQQRFVNYKRAVRQLQKFIDIDCLNELVNPKCLTHHKH